MDCEMESGSVHEHALQLFQAILYVGAVSLGQRTLAGNYSPRLVLGEAASCGPERCEPPFMWTDVGQRFQLMTVFTTDSALCLACPCFVNFTLFAHTYSLSGMYYPMATLSRSCSMCITHLLYYSCFFPCTLGSTSIHLFSL